MSKKSLAEEMRGLSDMVDTLNRKSDQTLRPDKGYSLPKQGPVKSFPEHYPADMDSYAPYFLAEIKEVSDQHPGDVILKDLTEHDSWPIIIGCSKDENTKVMLVASVYDKDTTETFLFTQKMQKKADSHMLGEITSAMKEYIILDFSITGTDYKDAWNILYNKWKEGTNIYIVLQVIDEQKHLIKRSGERAAFQATNPVRRQWGNRRRG